MCEIEIYLLPMMKGIVLRPPFLLGLDDCSVVFWFEGVSMLSSATSWSILKKFRVVMLSLSLSLTLSVYVSQNKRERVVSSSVRTQCDTDSFQHQLTPGHHFIRAVCGYMLLCVGLLLVRVFFHSIIFDFPDFPFCYFFFNMAWESSYSSNKFLN